MKNAPRKKPAPTAPAAEAIRVRGARQNNLRGVDLDIPAGLFTVVFMHTDLPEPVAPAISTWGILAISVTM